MANIGNTDAASVIEEVVSSVVQDTLIAEAVVMPSVSDMSSMVRAGMDTLKIPRFSALSIGSKTEDVALTAQAPTIATDDLVLDKHKGAAWFLEDITDIQSKVNILSKVVEDAARKMAEEVDSDVIAQLKLASAAAPDHRLQFANTPTDTIQEEDILEARRLLDVQNVPMSDRFLLVPPDQEKAMLKLADFIQAERYGSSDPIQNGEIGRVFGLRVLKTNISSALGAGEFLVYHRTAVAFARQQAVQLKSLYKPLEVGTEYAMTALWGAKVLDSGKRQVLYNATGA